MIRFVVPGTPVPWQRAGKARNGRSFEIPEMVAAKARIVLEARNAAAGRSFPVGPVRLDVVAVYPRPEDRPAWCPSALWTSGERVPAVTRADLSNVVKLVEDALGTRLSAGWRLWNDDNQISRINASSFYAAKAESPRTEISVETVS